MVLDCDDLTKGGTWCEKKKRATFLIHFALIVKKGSLVKNKVKTFFVPKTK